MLLVVLVLLGVAAFCFVKGYVLAGLLSLLGFSRKYGWPALIVASLILFYHDQWFVGALPLFLMTWNLVGLRLWGPRGTTEVITGGVRKNFYDYCKSYLIERRDLSEEQARILLCDTELAGRMDVAKAAWGFKDIGFGTDPDIFLIGKLFDAPQMGRINHILDEYAGKYPENEVRIRQYLKSKGYS